MTCSQGHVKGKRKVRKSVATTRPCMRKGRKEKNAEAPGNTGLLGRGTGWQEGKEERLFTVSPWHLLNFVPCEFFIQEKKNPHNNNK